MLQKQTLLTCLALINQVSISAGVPNAREAASQVFDAKEELERALADVEIAEHAAQTSEA